MSSSFGRDPVPSRGGIAHFQELFARVAVRSRLRYTVATMFRIAKSFQFCASHVLEGLPEDHPCARLHGHNYEIELILESDQLDAVGFVVDYNDLRRFRELLTERYDHRHLNDVVSFQPSAELLARHFFEVAREFWPSVRTVRLSETPRTWAEYSA